MNKRERVLNALTGKPVDVVPVSFWFHFSGRDAEGEGAVKAHLDYYRAADIDFLKIMSDGVSFAFDEPIQKASDWRRVKPKGKDSPFVRDTVWRAQRINEALKGECCTFYNVFAPFSLVRFFAGDARVMAHMQEDREAVLSALDAIAEDSAILARAVIEEGGCDGIYSSVQGGEVNRFTADEYRAYVKPSDLTILEAANEVSDLNIFHMCGYDGVRNHLEVWREYPATIFNWSLYIDSLTLSQGRKYLQPMAQCIMGGFDNRKTGLLYGGDKESIQAEARRQLADAGRLGTVICADCTIPADIDVNHIRWVVEAVHEASREE